MGHFILRKYRFDPHFMQVLMWPHGKNTQSHRLTKHTVQWPTQYSLVVPSSTKSTLVMLASTLLSLPFDDGRSRATLYLFTLQLLFWGNCTDNLFPFTWTVAIDWLGRLLLVDVDVDEPRLLLVDVDVDDNDDNDGGNGDDTELDGEDDCGVGVGAIFDSGIASTPSEIDAAEFERGWDDISKALSILWDGSLGW